MAKSRARTIRTTLSGHSVQACSRRLSQGKNFPAVGAQKYDVCLTPNQKKVLGEMEQKLGCGAFACAYSGKSPSTVVKITSDPEDVAALQLANQKGVKRAVKLHSAWKLRQDAVGQDGEDVPVYAVVTERVRPIPKDSRGKVDRWLTSVRDEIRDQVQTTGTADKETLVAETCPRTSKSASQCKHIVEGVADAYKQLSKVGIDWTDIHSGNIGTRANNEVVVLDLGLSREGGQPQVQTLAGQRKKLLRKALKGVI